MSGTGGFVRLLGILTLLIVVALASALSYSNQGYTLTKYPRVAGGAVVCVEGEVHPTNQTITVEGDGVNATVNPYVTINGLKHVFNMTVEDAAVRQRTQALLLGCNKIEYGADTDTQFKVRLDYASHWRPIIRYLEIGNLMVGHNVRYFISTTDADKRPIVTSRLNITDITRNPEAKPIYNAEFNGSAIRYLMEQPGNYKADMQVWDGYIWSDVWEVGFTAHVITTDEQKKAYRTYTLEDDPVQENDDWVPIAIKPDDQDVQKTFKRALDGAYFLYRRVSDWIRYKAAG